MDLERALWMLRGLGLEVRNEGARWLVVADGSDEAGAEPRFSLALHQVPSGWMLWGPWGDEAREFRELAPAIEHATQAFHEYRRLHSPRVYGDQFARFEAEAPASAIESALVEQGLIHRNEALVAMGLDFVLGASFRVPLQRRIVCVLVEPLSGGDWRLTIQCHRQAIAGGTGAKLPVRSYSPQGTALPDALAPKLSYEVARLIHPRLLEVASNLRWSVHQDPTCGPHTAEPTSG